jgi:hypothetical protein
MDRKPVPVGPAVEWESIRRKLPELHLTSLGPNPDDLSWLILGRPDPSASQRYWRAVSESMSQRQLSEAAQQLLKFFKDHPVTFQCSGWVATAMGQIILEDESAALKFLKPYWKQIRRPLPKSTMSAYEALFLVQGEHRKHWMAATNWMRHFCEREHNGREADFRFVDRALDQYRKRPGAMRHSCLSDEGLKAIAHAVVKYPDLSVSTLCDHALTVLFPETSQSTLVHLRASLQKKK